jgi:hypothetical protein
MEMQKSNDFGSNSDSNLLDDIYGAPYDHRHGNHKGDGLDLHQYAAQHGISAEQVWEKIKKGEVLARCCQGKVLILDDFDSIERLSVNISGFSCDTGRSEDAPVLQESCASDLFSDEKALQPGPLPSALDSSSASSSEIALLLDHLSLAKEENKEILRLTQDAIERVTAMTQSMIEMKDEIIKVKDEQLVILKEHKDTNEARIKSLLQEIEDLKMLNNLLTKESE